MAEYIEREALKQEIEKLKRLHNTCYPARHFVVSDIMACIHNAPAADVVEVETVAQMLCDAVGDECPCNYSPTDEWLTEVCELQDECPNPKEKLGCWKQYIKHYSERRAE